MPGVPHHATQRGVRRMATFRGEEEYAEYVRLLAESCERFGLRVWAWCLMPNHIHMMAVPRTEDALARAIGEAHRRYSRMVNSREGWWGHLFQDRFCSFPMDEPNTYHAGRYIEMNPVRAKLAKLPQDWKWSSARAHVKGKDDRLVKAKPLVEMVDGWDAYLHESDETWDSIRRHERTGRPLGSPKFVAGLEKITGRELAKRPPGPKPRRSRR